MSLRPIEIVNRAGAIPVIGTVVGALRITIAAVVAAATLIFAAVAWPCSPRAAKKSFDIGTTALQHTGLGVLELIPFVGGLAHYFLGSVTKEGSSFSMGPSFRIC